MRTHAELSLSSIRLNRASAFRATFWGVSGEQTQGTSTFSSASVFHPAGPADLFLGDYSFFRAKRRDPPWHGNRCGRSSDSFGQSHGDRRCYSVVTNTTADGSGNYPFLAWRPAEYTVTVEAPGFKTEELKGIVLAVNQNAREDIKLQVGSVDTRVEVTGRRRWSTPAPPAWAR